MDGLGLSSEDTALDRARPSGELAPIELDRMSRSQESQTLAELAEAEQSYGPESLQLLPALAKLSAIRIGRAEAERAAPLVLRALDISDRYPADRPDLVLLLTDLTRLCIKQSAHTLAEPLLLRLVEMKRGKGDDHPEVATVLASLATVRQALGQHESAEQLWRRVLEIREKTLAPNHFAVATAIERLADSCAARGKIAEAMQLFKRAQAMRELTLGAGHASLRVLRERVADLELQASEELFEVGEPSSMFAFAPTPVVPPVTIRPVTPRPLPIASPPTPTDLPTSILASPAPSINTALAPTPRISSAVTTQPAAGPPSFRDLVLSIEKDIEDEDAATAERNPLAAAFSTVATLVNNRRKAVALASGAVVILLLGLAADSRAGTEPERAPDTAAVPTAAPAPRLAATVAATPVGAAPSVSKSSAETVRSAISNFVSSTRAKSSESKSDKRSEERESTPPKVVIPKLSASMLAHADSVARTINAPASVQDAMPTEPMAVASRTRLYSTEQETNNGPVRARLIGAVPTPRLPDQLADVQGLVKVWVRVDTSGRPVMSTFSIENSPNPLLTAAVKRVITDLRFEPARSGGPNSRALVDSVQVGFNFSRSR